MYIFHALKNILRFWTLGMPLSILFPAVFAVSAVLHRILLRCGKDWLTRMVPILSAGILIVCEVSIWLIRSYAALILIVIMHVFAAALLGALFSGLLDQLFKKVRL